MIDFGDLKKKVYFPRPEEREKDPYVIYVISLWGKNWIGNTSAPGLLAGNKKFYPSDRCQPFSGTLWALCQDWSLRRQELEHDFDVLMTKGVGKP